MKQTLKNRIGTNPTKKIKKLIVYKAKSRGLILAEYNSIKDYVNAERVFNPKTRHHNVHQCITGVHKSTLSLHLQSRVVIKAIYE